MNKIIHTKKLTDYLKMVGNNKRIMTSLTDDVMSKITKQGGGCNIAGLGAGYHIKKTGCSDPIGLLLGYVSRYHFGLISDEAQKPLVDKVITKFKFDDSQYSERHKLVKLLQRLQDAHDSAWCEFSLNKPIEPMDYFLMQCEEIKKEFRLC